MVTYFARRTFDAQAAVDLTGETFAAAFAQRGRFRGGHEDAAVAWLYGIARNLLTDWHRRGAVERRALERLGVASRGLEDAELERVEELGELATLRCEVAARLDELGAADRLALRLRVVEELGYAEVAARLDVSEQAARARVSRALRELGRRLEALTGRLGRG
ncbi:MAG: RNA polymerase sigma factor [Solirubrobacteraceae bacterium MAG38_C4-C5]|nr:RNA polymerase sigma factor [Candidatus Siliceabacter maunaloa]